MTRHQERMQSADIASLVIDFGRMGSVDRISLDSKRSKQLGDYLEAILVDSHAVIEHVRYLQQGLGSRALPHGALSQERRVGFIDVGAVALSSVELLGVLLDPVELARLHDAIEESLPPFFAASALAAAGRQLEDVGLKAPELPRLIKPIDATVTRDDLVLTRSTLSTPKSIRTDKRVWVVHGEDCHWFTGSPWTLAVPPGTAQEGRIEAEWHPLEKRLDVRASGFLAPDRDKGATLSVTLLDDNEDPPVEAISRTLPLVTLRPPNGIGPGMSLRVRHTRAGCWDLKTYLAL